VRGGCSRKSGRTQVSAGPTKQKLLTAKHSMRASAQDVRSASADWCRREECHRTGWPEL
jgi:hypothetical protein